MSYERNSFTFYLSFEKAISRLSNKNQLLIYRAISRYSLFGEETRLEGISATIWDIIKPTLDKSRINSESGKRAKGITKPSLIGNCNAKKQSENEAKTKQDRDRDRDRDKYISIKAENREKSKRFIPPTLEEVKNYISENSYTVDANRFINYYESNGWMVGRNKMKDWKASVRTWEHNPTNQKTSSSIGVVLTDNSTTKYDNDKLW